LARLAGSNGKATARSIHEHSVSLFANYGYAAVSMRMIAEAVGVQPAALYQYHATKQDLLVHIMREHMERLLAAWQEEKTAPANPQTALEQFVRFHIRYHLVRPDHVFVSYMELRSLEPKGFEIIEKLRHTYEQILKKILAAGIEKKLFNCADPHVSAMAILAMLTGVNTWYRSGGRLSQAKIEAIYAAMVLRCVGAESEGEGNV